MSSLTLLQWIFLTQESNQGLLHYRQIRYQLSYQGNPEDKSKVAQSRKDEMTTQREFNSCTGTIP